MNLKIFLACQTAGPRAQTKVVTRNESVFIHITDITPILRGRPGDYCRGVSPGLGDRDCRPLRLFRGSHLRVEPARGRTHPVVGKDEQGMNGRNGVPTKLDMSKLTAKPKIFRKTRFTGGSCCPSGSWSMSTGVVTTLPSTSGGPHSSCPVEVRRIETVWRAWKRACGATGVVLFTWDDGRALKPVSLQKVANQWV